MGAKEGRQTNLCGWDLVFSFAGRLWLSCACCAGLGSHRLTGLKL